MPRIAAVERLFEPSRSQTRWAHGVAYAPGMICYQSNRNGPATGPKSGPTFLYPLATLRGRPPRRPLARELAALRSLVRRPTNAAAVTRFTIGRARPPADIDTLATLTSARGCSCGWTYRYALSVRVIALAAFARVAAPARTQATRRRKRCTRPTPRVRTQPANA